MKLITFEVIILDKMLKCTVLLSYAVGKQLLKLLCRLETKRCSHKSLLLKRWAQISEPCVNYKLMFC